MSRPGLDVIVPCYNYGRFLRACVTSVLEETRISIRVLIIDDASSDGSDQEARQLAAQDERIDVRIHAHNKGHVATYNEGIEWVEQDYMLLLSADDMVAPGALIRALELMEAQRDIAFVFGQAIRFQDASDLARQVGELGPAEPVFAHHVASGWDFIGRLCHSSMNPVETATAVVRSAVQKQVGGYSSTLPHSGDLEMWLRCARHGRVAEFATPQAFVRLHGANMRNDYCQDEALGDYLQRRDAFLSFFDQAHDGPERAVLRDVALDVLAQNLLWDASRAVEQGRRCSQMVALAVDIRPDIRWTQQYHRLMIKRGLHQALDVGRRNPKRHATT